MVTKRYIKREGKTFGPYYYESYRDTSGKVKKKYLRNYDSEKGTGRLTIILAVTGILVILFSFFVLLNWGHSLYVMTGGAIYESKEIYAPNEPLTGEVLFSLRQGESIPSGTEVNIELGDFKQQFVLSDFVNYQPVYGPIYAENSELSGDGMVFGIPGTKEVYPDVEFELEIYTEQKSGGSSASGSETSASVQETPGKSESKSPRLRGSSAVENANTITAAAISETVLGTIHGRVSKDNSFSYQLEDGQKARIVPGSVKSNSQVLADDELSLAVANNLLTVSTNYAVKEEGFGKEFLGEKNAMTFKIDIADLGIKASSGKLKVDLSYDGKEIAHYEDVILVDENGLSEKAPRAEVTQTQEIPSIRISPGETVVVNLQDYFVGATSYSVQTENIQTSFEGNLLRLTPDSGFKGARRAKIVAENEKGKIESNEFLILVSSGAVKIKTTRGKIILGQPVKWTKEISLDSPDKISVEIPKESENIQVNAIREGQEKVVETVENPASLLTGNVVIEVNLHGKSREIGLSPQLAKSFKLWFANFRAEFNRKLDVRPVITGQAAEEIQQPSDTIDVPLENPETKDYLVEYETPAPESSEVKTEKGKIVTVTAPSELGYTDVIAFTKLDNTVPVANKNKIKLYWYNYEKGSLTDEEIQKAKTTKVADVLGEKTVEEVSTTEGDAILTGSIVSASEAKSSEFVREETVFDVYDLDGDGMIDYIEWVVPHLSDQTYEIVIAAKDAEHLDENRTFVSNIYENVSLLDNVWSEIIPENNYVRVTFEKALTSSNDITVYPQITSGAPQIVVYEENGTQAIATFGSLKNDEYNKVYLTNLQGNQKTFDLKIVNGAIKIDHIIDPADNNAPEISFSSDTTSAGTQSNNNIYVNLVTADMSDHYSFVDFDKSLMYWYRMENVSNISNGKIHDDSSYGRDGIRSGASVQTDFGRFGKGLNSSTDGGYAGLGYSTADEPSCFWPNQCTVPFTFSTWFKVNTNGTLIYNYQAPPVFVDGWGIEIANDKLAFRNHDGTLAYNITSTTTVTDGKWRHLAAIFDGDETGELYLNGALESTGSVGQMFYGQDVSSLIWSINGTIDETMLFTRVLSAQEILALYNATANQYYNNFTSLADNSTHTFQGFAVDAVGNKNQTEERTVVIEKGSVSRDGVSVCQNLTLPNESYVLENDVSTNGTCFTVSANNVTIDGRGFSIIYGNQSDDKTKYYGIYSSYNQTTVRNITLRRGSAAPTPQLTYGIYFTNNSNGVLENVILDSSYRGVYFYLSSGNSLTNVVANDNTRGIYFYLSSNNVLADVLANNNTDNGITLYLSNNSQLTDIEANGNLNHGVYVYQSSNNSLGDVVASDNVASGITLTAGSGSTNLTEITANNNSAGVDISSNGNQLVDITANNNDHGVYLSSSDSNNITDVIANNNDHGVYLSSSDSNNITDVIANNNTNNGIDIESSSSNLLANVTINNNLGKGIYCLGAQGNQLIRVTADNNIQYGIYFSSSDSNNLTSFTADNSTVGIYIESCSNNLFSNGIINFSAQDAVEVRTGPNADDVFNNITIANTNISFWDISFLTGELVENMQFIDMPGIGKYDLTSDGGTIVVKNTKYGEIKFLQAVTGNGTNFTADFQILNDSVAVNSTNPGLNKSANITLYNLPIFVEPTVLRDGLSCPEGICHNFTSLSAGTVVFNVSSWTNYSVVETPQITTPPNVEFVYPTPNGNSLIDGSGLIIAVNVTTYNATTINTLRYRIYNSSILLVNETYTNSSNLTFFGLQPGSYTYNVWANDSTGGSGISSDRTVTIAKSCFNLTTECREGSSCVIGENCYLSSEMCSDNDCNFTVLITNSTIYTFYDSNGNGKNLKLTMTSNTQRAPLTFLNGATISFGGRNGTDLGSGGAGGKGGTLNITVPDLLNTTNAKFVGQGGYTTQGSPGNGPAGGNGGNIILNFHGLIQNFTGATPKPSLVGGSSAGGIYGSAGTLAYHKDLNICPRDADINGNGLINSQDIQLIRNSYNKETGESGFLIEQDVACNGKVNVIGLSRIGFEINTR